jgi:hypothetical protein
MIKNNALLIIFAGVILALMAVSFLAGAWYQDQKQTIKWETSLLESFGNNLKRSFSKNTSISPEEWKAANPMFGQCGVAALTVEHYFGGKILEADIPEDLRGMTMFSTHLWNNIGGQNIDFTKEQFPPEFPYDDLIHGKLGGVRVVSREYLLDDLEIAVNFWILQARLEKVLDNTSTVH